MSLIFYFYKFKNAVEYYKLILYMMAMEKDEIVKYWIESADSDFQVMQSLFDNKYYVWALFLGHLVIEKLLKAYHVKIFRPIIPESIISLR